VAQPSYTDDFYQREARRLGLRARSYFKLEEIDAKEKILKTGMRVLDLGAAPGSWSQYVLNKTDGKVDLTMIDIQVIEAFPHFPEVKRLQADVNLFETLGLPTPYDLILSDMAPATAGHAQSDSMLSADLVFRVIDLSVKHLKKNGALVVKYLQGGDLPELQKKFKSSFSSYRIFKPMSSRKNSSETFFIAKK
jgi:23S rRNA (uridine2552-2'-O)-methyltransferase